MKILILKKIIFVGHKNLNKVLMPHVVSMVDESIIVHAEEATRSNSKVTSVVRYQRKPYCREKVLRRESTLT